MARLAIIGHETRGKEVMELLEMLGGKNDNHCCGAFINRIYFINENGYIESCDRIRHLEYHQLTLEEFLAKWPYKVGDYISKYNGMVHTMRWDKEGVVYTLVSASKLTWCTPDAGGSKKEEDADRKFKEMCPAAHYVDKNKSRIWQPYYSSCSRWCSDWLWVSPIAGFCMNENKTKEELKEKDMNVHETMKQMTDVAETITVTSERITAVSVSDTLNDTKIRFQNDAPKKTELVLGDDFEVVVEDGKTYVVRKKPQYPETYEKCCKIVNGCHCKGNAGWKANLLINLQKLLICRDAYWKHAGDWKPEFKIGKKKYCIMTRDNKIINATVEETNRILVFPTEEMRDAFYENFKDLIEECKELL